MGNYLLKAGRSSQLRCTYFKPEGASSTLHLAKVNANLADLSDRPLKDKKSISISDKDAEVDESLIRESGALKSHLYG